MKKFASAYEASKYAAGITDEWISDIGKPMSKSDLFGFAGVSDENFPLDEDDNESYYIVDENGSVGMTTDGEKTVHWFAKATRPAYTKNASDTSGGFCTNCGAKLTESASFCPNCGQKIERKPKKRFCTNCGTELPISSAFCPECGTPVSAKAESTPNKPTPAEKKTVTARTSDIKKPVTTAKVPTHGAVGYSKVIDDPRFLAAVKKNKKSAKGCATVLAILPIIVVPIYTHFSDGLSLGKGLLYGVVLSAIIMTISLLASLKEMTEKTFDGVVEDRYEKKVRMHEDLSDDDPGQRWEKHYYTVIRKDGGGKHKIEEKDTTTYYYMNEGDRVRYHGKMRLLYPYEKYDKSHDDYVICAFCRHHAPISDNDCPKCHNPILK